MEIAITIVGIVHVILSVLIIALILLQSGKQAGLSGAVAGAGESFFGKNKGRTMDAIFSRFTKICAVGFLCTSLFLAYAYATKDDGAATAPSEEIVTETRGVDIPLEATVVPAETPAAATPAAQ